MKFSRVLLQAVVDTSRRSWGPTTPRATGAWPDKDRKPPVIIKAGEANRHSYRLLLLLLLLFVLTHLESRLRKSMFDNIEHSGAFQPYARCWWGALRKWWCSLCPVSRVRPDSDGLLRGVRDYQGFSRTFSFSSKEYEKITRTVMLLTEDGNPFFR